MELPDRGRRRCCTGKASDTKTTTPHVRKNRQGIVPFEACPSAKSTHHLVGAVVVAVVDPPPGTHALAVGARRHVGGDVKYRVAVPHTRVLYREYDHVLRAHDSGVVSVGDGERAARDVVEARSVHVCGGGAARASIMGCWECVYKNIGGTRRTACSATGPVVMVVLDALVLLTLQRACSQSHIQHTHRLICYSHTHRRARMHSGVVPWR